MNDRQIIEYLTSRSWIQPQSEGGCWLWQGPLHPDGYGVHTLYSPDEGKRTWLVHRLSLKAHGYPIDGLTVDHQCVNKACWHPLHLELVTREENTRRAANKRWGIYRRLYELKVRDR